MLGHRRYLRWRRQPFPVIPPLPPKTPKLRLTKRVCAGMASRLWVRGDQATVDQYKALTRIARCLDSAYTTKRGGVTIEMCWWSVEHLQVLRDILTDVLAGCVQMQIRRALSARIAEIDDYIDTSAIERLGRLT